MEIGKIIEMVMSNQSENNRKKIQQGKDQKEI